MNEAEFKYRWSQEKPAYKAWGYFVKYTVESRLTNSGKNLTNFLKIPTSIRVKDDDSLLDKAFYRPNKNYTDPYNEIEDKVGVRFIVLLLDELDEVCQAVQEIDSWHIDPCKHFQQDKDANPLLFTYQSVHYIVRPNAPITVNGVNIPESVSCELQVRTLLQHAHAELTHDSIYKAKKAVAPQIHRLAAKSMALIEATDEFFQQATNQLTSGPLNNFSIVAKMDALFESINGIKPNNHKSSMIIWDTYEQLLNDEVIESVREFFNKQEHSFLSDKIVPRYKTSVFYQQSVILFLYWMVSIKKRRLLADWPFDRELLEPIASDLGTSLIST